ncbi:hypothetical protein V2J09_009594 [Rumex salicifolius]
MASSLLLLLLIFLISDTTPEAAAAAATRIPLSKSPKYPSSSSSTTAINGWESINLAARTSLTRARNLKRNRHHPSSTAAEVKLPSYPRSYGGYSISLSLGTPPQRVSLVLDTGSSLVWTPCATSLAAYSCQNCSFSGVDPSKVPIFTPNTSSTVRTVTCQSPMCRLVFGSDLKCPKCNPKHSKCSPMAQQHCPYYQLEYGLGDTAGLMVSDNLILSNKGGDPVRHFLFGCSLLSNRQPEGIAGFGRGPTSIPAQLRLTKFSYCLASHQFDDDSTHSGDLVLYNGRANGTTHGVSYAPFIKSPVVSPYSEYYYISLSKFVVGGKVVQIPSEYLVASAKGNGGVIVDSGSTFTFMERAVFGPVARELEKQMSKYKRAEEVEQESGLGPCYNITGQADVEVPKLVLVFTGGARMDLPLADYFILVNGGSIACMTVLTDPEGPVSPGVPSGPAMILGNYQQQDFYMEYDLENQRFGFKPQKCDHSS